MKSKGGSKFTSNKRFKFMMMAHLAWLTMVCILGAWWGSLLLRQGARIADLEGLLGLAVNITQDQWHRTQRMLYWESLTFFGLVMACTSFLSWLYWRDACRARGLQAFYASVTHELRTPLTSIRLQAESIAESLHEAASSKHLINRLMEDTHRLESQVERTLELARVEGGGPVHIQCLQLKPWLDRFLKTWTADHPEKIEIKVEVEDILIEADPVAIQIILKNLLENSVKHSKKDKISIWISTHTIAGEKFLKVQDNGEAFQGNPQDLGILFSKGVTSPGTGVGLYLVKTLMKQMGGRVHFGIESGFEVSLGFREGVLNG